MLEIVFTIAIIIALLLFFGIPLETIFVIFASVILGLIAIALLLFILFFVITDISLLFRRRVKGVFLRIDDTDRWDHAVYSYEGQEYNCLFPAESFGRKRIYHEKQAYSLLISRNPKKHTAYDRHSLFIIAVGSAVSVIAAFALITAAIFIRNGL